MLRYLFIFYFFFSSRRRHTRCYRDWSSDVCSSDLSRRGLAGGIDEAFVDQAGADGAELFGAAAHDGGDVAGGVFAGAEFGHRAQASPLLSLLRRAGAQLFVGEAVRRVAPAARDDQREGERPSPAYGGHPIRYSRVPGSG